MVIEQGAVVWLDLGPAHGSEPAGRRPVLVLQADRFNQSRIATVVVVAITSTMKLADAPGNVRLRRGEAALPRASVVNVSQVATVDRTRVRSACGRLSRARLLEVWSGVRLLLEPPA